MLWKLSHPQNAVIRPVVQLHLFVLTYAHHIVSGYAIDNDFNNIGLSLVDLRHVASSTHSCCSGYGKLQPPPLAPFAAKPSANENLRCCVDRNRHLREIVQIVCNALRPNCHPSCLIGSVGRFVALKSEDRVVKNIVEVFYPSSLVNQGYGKLGRFCIRCNALLFNLVIHHNLGRIEVNGGMLGGAHDVEHHLAATANFNRCRRGSRTLFYLAYGMLRQENFGARTGL